MTPRTPLGHFERSRARRAAAPAIGTKRTGSWTWTSYGALAELADEVRGGLALRGVTRGSRVLYVGDNSVEWAAIAYACFGLRAAIVPMVASQHPGEQRAILDDAHPSLVIAATRVGYDRFEGHSHRVCISFASDHPDSFARLCKDGVGTRHAIDEPAPEEPAAILYTPGTGGRPKGVVLSHQSLDASAEAVLASLPLTSADRTLSFLPWAHALGHGELYALLRVGGSMALNDSPEHLLTNLEQVTPTVLVTVPLALHRMHQRMVADIKNRPRLMRSLFERARELSSSRRPLGLAERITLEAAERVVLGPLRLKLGGKLRFVVSGGAPLDREVAQFLADIGLTVYEGYGLTEAAGVVSVNGPADARAGTVGKPVHGVRVAIASSEPGANGAGEIVVYGPTVMRGYFEDEALTKAAFTKDGGLRTGDFGHLDGDGYLHLYGRLDERYKLASGHDVLPAALEERLKLSPYIKSAMLYGEGRTHNVALVVVDLDAISRWVAERDLHFDDTRAMLASTRVRSHILAEIGEQSRDWHAYERVRAVALLDRDFGVDDALATASGKIRREAVLERYKDDLEALYPPVT